VPVFFSYQIPHLQDKLFFCECIDRDYLTNIRKVGRFSYMDLSKSFSKDFYIFGEVGTLFAVFYFSHPFSRECLRVSGGERYMGVQMGRM
jgi:hypothetical protein